MCKGLNTQLKSLPGEFFSHFLMPQHPFSTHETLPVTSKIAPRGPHTVRQALYQVSLAMELQDHLKWRSTRRAYWPTTLWGSLEDNMGSHLDRRSEHSAEDPQEQLPIPAYSNPQGPGKQNGAILGNTQPWGYTLLSMTLSPGHFRCPRITWWINLCFRIQKHGLLGKTCSFQSDWGGCHHSL